MWFWIRNSFEILANQKAQSTLVEFPNETKLI